MSPKSQTTIGFRLSADQHERLEAAAARETVSAHELARRYVVATLTAPAATASLHAEVVSLRTDLAVAIEALLLATRTLSPEDAKRFVHEKFHL